MYEGPDVMPSLISIDYFTLSFGGYFTTYFYFFFMDIPVICPFQFSTT